jgi:tetratricopeptide (TPR) repeat protein
MLDHDMNDLKKAFFLNPTNVNYIFLYADETILKGDWLSSTQHFNKIPFARYLARRGAELANDSDPVQAKKGLYYLSYARKILPEPQISSSLGSILCFKYKSYKKGVPLLWEALKENPKNTSFYDSLSRVFANQEKKEMYRSLNELARRLNPLKINTFLNIGSSLVKDNKIDEGIQYFKYAKTLDPKMPQIHYSLARAYEKQEKTFLAEAEYLEVIELNPSDQGPRFEWGVFLFQKKDFSRALTQFTVAITLKPDFVWSYYYRSLCYLESKNLEKAKEDMEQCLLLEPTNQSFKNKLIDINSHLKTS